MKRNKLSPIIFFLLLLCSHALADAGQPQLPGEVRINKEAGCGGHLSVTVRLQSGEALLFDVDTGSPVTIFDESLEAKLGKRLGTVETSDWGVKRRAGIYAAPKLYLGNTLLMTGTKVLTSDLKKAAHGGEHPLGILGMDCLQHYCIELDFAAGEMRFLRSAQLDPTKPINAFPLILASVGEGSTLFSRTFIRDAPLLGGRRANLLMDTGLDVDGALEPEIIQEQQLKGQGARRLNKTMWYFPECFWEGQRYTNIVVDEATSVVAGKDANVIGLRFLARQQVTFDFPNRVMYLQPELVGPLPNDSMLQANARANSLVTVGDELPADVEARLNAELAAQSLPLRFRWFGGTITIKKPGSTTSFHYTVVRKSRHDPWKIKKAWCTDQYGNIIKTYSIPE